MVAVVDVRESTASSVPCAVYRVRSRATLLCTTPCCRQSFQMKKDSSNAVVCFLRHPDDLDSRLKSLVKLRESCPVVSNCLCLRGQRSGCRRTVTEFRRDQKLPWTSTRHRLSLIHLSQISCIPHTKNLTQEVVIQIQWLLHDAQCELPEAARKVERMDATHA